MFYQNFIRLCAEQNVRPNTVTRELGLSTATATDWKNGSIPRDVTLLKLANYFNVSVDYLLGKDEPAPHPHKNVLRVPVYGRVAAGIPMEDIEDIDDYGEKYMFYENFLQLCSQKNVYPNTVTSELGLSAATATSWKKGAVPREVTLKKIAEYFNVSVDYLLGKEIPQKEDTLILSDLERQIILSYRLHPNMHESICRLLDIDSTP